MTVEAAFSARWGASNPYAAMERAISETLGDLAYPPPVDLVSVARQLGAEISLYRPRREARPHAHLTVQNSRWQIAVPATESCVRRRFSIAHEMAHVILFDSLADQPSPLSELRAHSLSSLVERLCDFGAARIVMPFSAFNSEMGYNFAPTYAAIQGIATRFLVSVEAAARRATEVRPEWSMIMWRYDGRHRRGPSWRISGSAGQAVGPFVRPGLSSRRLVPDLVAEAGRVGDASALAVSSGLPRLSDLMDARAWIVGNSQPSLISTLPTPESGDSRAVFLFFRS